MHQTELIIDVIKSTLEIFNEDDLLRPQEAKIIVHWDHEICEIGIRSDPKDGWFFEHFHVERKQRKSDFIQGLVNSLIKFSTLNLHVSFELYEHISGCFMLKTESCATLRERVADFTGLHPKELFKVRFTHENCNVEVIFFMSENAEEAFENVLTTGGYFNPVSTNELYVKLLELSNFLPEFDKIGFVGTLSEDKFTTVKKCLQMVHEKIVKHAEQIKQREKEARQVDKWESAEDIQNGFDSSPEKKKKDEEPERTNRYSLRYKREKVVDLTSSEEEKAEEPMLWSDDSFYSTVCSDILEFGSTSDYHGCETEFPQQSDKQTKTFEAQMPEEETRISRWVTITTQASTISAESYYEQKANRDYQGFESDSKDHRKKTIVTVTERKHPHQLNKDIGRSNVPLKRERLLDPEDYDKKPRASSFLFADQSELKKQQAALKSYTIPKKPSTRSPQPQPVMKINVQNVSKRRAIHANVIYPNSSSPEDPQRKARINKIMTNVVEKANNSGVNNTNSSAEYDPKKEAFPLGAAFSRDDRYAVATTTASSSATCQNDEVINVDDDDVEIIADDENSDTNNNNRRKLYNPDPPTGVFRIFQSKNGQSRSKPNFSKSYYP